MNRYALFAGDRYYPSGGWEDYRGSFKTADEAMAEVTLVEFTWAHVVDLQFGIMVAYCDSGEEIGRWTLGPVF